MDYMGQENASEPVAGTQDSPIIIVSDTPTNTSNSVGTRGQAMKTSKQEAKQLQVSGRSSEAITFIPNITASDINSHSQKAGIQVLVNPTKQLSVPSEARVIPGSDTCKSNTKKRPRTTNQATDILPNEHERLIFHSKKLKQAQPEKSPQKVQPGIQDQRTEDEVLVIPKEIVLEEERRKIFRKIHAQFAACRQSPLDTSHKSRLATFEDRRGFTAPPIYVPMCTKEKGELTFYYLRWEQHETRAWGFTGCQTEDDMPTNICHSLHFRRMKDIVAKNPFIYAKYISPAVDGEWIYYSVMILPGANDEFTDQGYVGKTSENVTRRWGTHCSRANTTASTLVDLNLQLFLQYYNGQPNMVRENFAIFALGCVVNLHSHSVELDIGQPVLDVIESHLIRSLFCRQHGRPPLYCATHGRNCAVHSPLPCPPECNIETQCTSNSDCTKLQCNSVCTVPTCSYVTLSDMRFGLNSSKTNTSYQKLIQRCRAIEDPSIYHSLLVHKQKLQRSQKLPQMSHEDQCTCRAYKNELDQLNRSSAYH